MSDDRCDKFELRQAAEARARQTARTTDDALTYDAALLHELQVHQIELEMQNEALRKAQRALEAARDRYVDLFDFAPVAYITLSRDGHVTEANFAAANDLGMSRQELLKHCIDQFIAPAELERWRAHLSAAWGAPGTPAPDIELQIIGGDGVAFPAQLHCMATDYPDGSTLMRIALFDDTERCAAAAEMQRLANYDALTQLPNRRLFQDRLAHAVAASRRNGLYGAILFLDLDNFKVLNDTCGHDAGDLLLIEIAHRLRSNLREGDTVARIGGDEFVMILERLAPTEDTAALLASQIGHKLNEVISERAALGHTEFQCTTSIGARLFGPGEDVDDLLKEADQALYQAKSAGRNQVRFFDSST